MNFSWLMDEETMTHPYNGIVFSNRKEKYRNYWAELAKFDNYYSDVAVSRVSDGCGPPSELQRRQSSRQAGVLW